LSAYLSGKFIAFMVKDSYYHLNKHKYPINNINTASKKATILIGSSNPATIPEQKVKQDNPTDLQQQHSKQFFIGKHPI